MQKISYKEFTEATKLSPNAVATLHEFEQLQYVVVENVLENPDKLLTYLDKFPALDKLDFLRNGKVISHAPGLQQLVPANYLQDLTQYFNTLIYPLIEQEFRLEWFTNIFYPDMVVKESSRYPHTDTFDMAINIWLTENDPKDGTAFYKKGDKYYGGSIEYDFNDDVESVWKPFEGNSTYKKILVVPSKFNTAVIYSGKFYHSAYYMPQLNKERKSLVGGLFIK